MATPAWQPRPVQTAGGAQPPVPGPPSHWGAPGTSPVQGPPRPPFGPPTGPSSAPPANYPQTSASLPSYRGPNTFSSVSSSGLQPPIPAGSSAGIPQTGPYAPSSMALYGPPVVSFPSNRWQPQPPGSTSTTSPPVTGRASAEGSVLVPSPPIGASGPVTSQTGTASVSAPVVQQPSYPPFPSGLTQQIGPWVPKQQGNQLPRPPFSPYPSNFPAVAFPGHLHVTRPTVQDMPGTVPPLGGPTFGPPGDSSFSQPLNMWGSQAPSSGSSLSAPGKEPVPANGNPTISEPSAFKGSTSSGEDRDPTSNDILDKTKKFESAEEFWTAHKTVDGTLYYYNSVSGQSTYDKPPGFKGEAEKVTAQPTPVSWERVSGTDWALVTTNDGKKYYYNTKTQVTSWQVPTEVTDMKKKLLEEAAAKALHEAGVPPGTSNEKSTVSFSLNVPAAVTGGREAIGHKGLIANSALDLIKKKLQDPGAPATTSPLPPNVSGSSMSISTSTVDLNVSKSESKEKAKGTNLTAVSSESSSESEDEEPGPTKEERISLFKEMLKEKGIAPFSKWEKELPKIIFDVRFKAIPSHTERRAIFEHYVRTRADEERKEKRAAQKAAVEGFKQLLEEASKDLSHHTTYDHFARTWSHDYRFEALDRKDREGLLNERVLPLKKAEEEKVRAEHAAAVGGFKALLTEKGDITTNSRWSKVKDSLRNDPRYNVVKRDEREGLFNLFLAELMFAEQEAERAAKAKREEEEKLKEREREMRKRKERDEQEMERVRAKARRKDAVTAYQALLTEKIKDPEASWTEGRPKLEKDPLGRATMPELDHSDRERLFREHVNELFERCVREYRLLLADVITGETVTKREDGKLILTSWSEAKKLLKPDPRYNKMPRRDRESLWRRHADDTQRRMKVVASAASKSERVGAGAKLGSSVESSRRSPGLRRLSSRR